jgi:hypothetical protein
VARPNKKPKPTFDVARDPIADSKSGWVYRSDPPPAPPVTPFGPVVRDVPPAYAVPARTDDVDRFQPDTPAVPAPRNWVATGVYLMVLPVSIGMSIMFAPVSWMLGIRSRR